MPDIQVRTFVTNFESIFISHLQSGNRAVGTEEQGEIAPLDCGQNISKTFTFKSSRDYCLPTYILRPSYGPASQSAHRQF